MNIINLLSSSGAVPRRSGAAGPEQGNPEWRRKVRDNSCLHDGASGTYSSSIQMCRWDQSRWIVNNFWNCNYHKIVLKAWMKGMREQSGPCCWMFVRNTKPSISTWPPSSPTAFHLIGRWPCWSATMEMSSRTVTLSSTLRSLWRRRSSTDDILGTEYNLYLRPLR